MWRLETRRFYGALVAACRRAILVVEPWDIFVPHGTMTDQRVRRTPVRSLDLMFAAGSRVAILRCLWWTSGAHTGRAIGRAVVLSHHVVHRALQPIGAQGVWDVKSQGRSIVYRLNQEHWLVREGRAISGDFASGWPGGVDP